MSPQQTADMVKVLCEAGIDFVKDDELMANPPHSPFDERVDTIMRVINAHADRTGKKVMYAFNVSDELDAMQRHYEKIVNSGGTCAMISLNSVGLSGAKKICDLGALAIHGHRNGWGMLNRHRFSASNFPRIKRSGVWPAWTKSTSTASQTSFGRANDPVVRSMAACAKPLLGGMSVLPVVSSGQWGGQACETHRRTQTVDLLYMAGGGIAAHPDGPAAGVRSLQKWWEAAVEGLALRTGRGEVSGAEKVR